MRQKKADTPGLGKRKHSSERTGGKTENGRRNGKSKGIRARGAGRPRSSPAEGREDPRGRDPSALSFLRVTPAEVGGPGEEGGVGKAAGTPGWEDGHVRTYGIKVSIQSLKLWDRMKKLNTTI